MKYLSVPTYKYYNLNWFSITRETPFLVSLKTIHLLTSISFNAIILS